MALKHREFTPESGNVNTYAMFILRAEESQRCEEGVDGERPDRMPH